MERAYATEFDHTSSFSCPIFGSLFPLITFRRHSFAVTNPKKWISHLFQRSIAHTRGAKTFLFHKKQRNPIVRPRMLMTTKKKYSPSFLLPATHGATHNNKNWIPVHWRRLCSPHRSRGSKNRQWHEWGERRKFDTSSSARGGVQTPFDIPPTAHLTWCRLLPEISVDNLTSRSRSLSKFCISMCAGGRGGKVG